jgi:hypothetical protein
MKAVKTGRTLIRSHAYSNEQLLEGFFRYLLARGRAAPTIRSYRDSVSRLVESLGAQTIVNVERSEVQSWNG